MKNEIVYHEFDIENVIHSIITPENNKLKLNQDKINDLAEILFITSYPPRECGIIIISNINRLQLQD